MSTERIIGVDFGTSTSVIRVKRYQDGEPVGDRLGTDKVTFNMGSTMVPTLIQKIPSGDSYFGYEAEIAHRNAKTLQNFKVDIENPDEGIRRQARELTAEFFIFLAKSYRAQSEGGHLGESGDQERTIISYPVKWSEETKAFMVQTAKDAGFPNVEGVDEAQAAIQAVTVQNADLLTRKGYFQDGVPVNILLIDMGAGTTDLVLCRHTPGERPKTDTLCTWPQEGNALFGGQEMDALLRSYISQAMPEDGADLVLKKIAIEKYKAWKEGTVSPALEKGEAVDYFSALDDLLNLMDIDAEYSVNRTSLEDFAAHYLRQFPELVNGCVSAAGLSGDDVDLVILTGGHSQWYFVREMLSGKLARFGKIDLGKIQAEPERIIPITLPQETVALGLVYWPLRVDTPPHDFNLHKVLEINYYEGGNELFCKVVGVAGFCEGDEFAVFNEDGNIIGTDKVIGQHPDPDDDDSIVILVENKSNIEYEQDFYLITLPAVESDYDTAIVAALAEKGQGRRTVEYRRDCGDDAGWDGAFIMYVTNVNEEKGTIEGISLQSKLNESLKNGFTMEMSVFKQDRHIPFTWERVTEMDSGFDAVFTGSTLNVEVGDVISNCEMDDFHSITCQRITSWKHRLHYIRTSNNQPFAPESDFEIKTFGGNTCAITKYTGQASDVKIPEYIRGQKVVCIEGFRAFRANSIQKVIIPQTVTKIGMAAFQECKNLRTVIAHDNIDEICYNAFALCDNLEIVDFGMGNCVAGKVVFPPSLRIIGPRAFTNSQYNCIFNEAMLSRKTQLERDKDLLHSVLGLNKTFAEKNCKLFYYD